MEQDIMTVWNELNGQLYNFVNSKIKNPDISKDIVQDVFVKVFSKIDTLQNQEKLVSWIYQITRNEIVTHFRKNKNQLTLEISPTSEPITKDLTPEFSQCIIPMIDLLPEKYKEALLLSEIKNMPQKELAIHLGISYSAAKSRVQRGRVMLKDLLQQCCIISTDAYGNIIDYDLLGNGKKC